MITPVLLCGGSGTRLWPLSRKSYPKQFTKLFGNESLLQASARRLTGSQYASPVVITGSDFRFVVTEQLEDCGVAQSTLLIEPDGRNTAPAILAAAVHLAAADPETLMLVAPSDHVIPDKTAFDEAIARGVPDARAGNLVTFGITPTRPESGYGYLALSEPTSGAPVALERFVEKPDTDTAVRMLEGGNYLWNAGIFLFSARAIIDAFQAHAPHIVPPVVAAVEGMRKDLHFFRLEPSAWCDVADVAIDYAVMEKADNLTVVPYSGEWSDLGGWDAVRLESTKDADGNASSGPVTAINCANSLLRSESDGLELVGIGLSDTMVIATPDAVLVAGKDSAQDVRLAVDALKAKRAKQATEFPSDHRPWGWFETLALSDRFQVKRIVVKPGASLSLQSHHHRAEHWVVVQGTARVTIDGDVTLVSENEAVYVPLGAVHRMENPGKLPMVLIEVQTGSYLGEDDIIRYEDVYERGGGPKG